MALVWLLLLMLPTLTCLLKRAVSFLFIARNFHLLENEKAKVPATN